MTDTTTTGSAEDVLPVVVVALLTSDLRLLDRAGRTATSIRERQLVALADAHLRGRVDLLDALLHDHLDDYPL